MARWVWLSCADQTCRRGLLSSRRAGTGAGIARLELPLLDPQLRRDSGGPRYCETGVSVSLNVGHRVDPVLWWFDPRLDAGVFGEKATSAP